MVIMIPEIHCLSLKMIIMKLKIDPLHKVRNFMSMLQRNFKFAYNLKEDNA